MRWGASDARWVRPLQSILCLLDGEVVPFTFAGVESGDTTCGHRFMAPGPFAVRDFADYRGQAAHGKVILDGIRAAEIYRARGRKTCGRARTCGCATTRRCSTS